MLGRLAKWLRLLGYDTGYDNTASDAELARRARAEERVLLTRDHELADRRGVRTLLVESEVLQEQVREVWNALGPPPDPALSRCAICNQPLQPIARDEIVDRVPPYVHRTQSDFHCCPQCRRIYWPGTHYDAMRAQMRAFGIE
jgi:uncharacterized protein with PIN domain